MKPLERSLAIPLLRRHQQIRAPARVTNPEDHREHRLARTAETVMMTASQTAQTPDKAVA